jgi:hypothetical protein
LHRLEITPEFEKPFAMYDETDRLGFSSLFWQKGPDQLVQYSHDEAMKLWHHMVSSYSRRCLSFAKDKLPAISGLTSQFGPIIKSCYLIE